MTTTEDTTRRIGDHYVVGTLGPTGSDFAHQIVHGSVYADAECTVFLGLIQLGDATGTCWMLSLGEGWLTTTAPDIYEAVSEVGRLRADSDGMRARLLRLWDAASTPELRADMRGLVHELAAGHGNSEVLRQAALHVQTHLY